MTSPVVRIDDRGKRCPQPVISLARAAKYADPGTIIVITADDPAALSDIPAWCEMKGMTLVETSDAGDGATAFRVQMP